MVNGDCADAGSVPMARSASAGSRMRKVRRPVMPVVFDWNRGDFKPAHRSGSRLA